MALEQGFIAYKALVGWASFKMQNVYFALSLESQPLGLLLANHRLRWPINYFGMSVNNSFLLARSFPNIQIRPEEKSNDSKRDDFDFHLPSYIDALYSNKNSYRCLCVS